MSARKPLRKANARAVKKVTYARARAQGAGKAEAARRAGYAPGGAAEAACHLEKLPDVQEAIAKQALEADADGVMTTTEILRGLSDIARLDPAEFFEEGTIGGRYIMRVRQFKRLPLHVRRCVDGFKVIKRNLTAGDRKVDELMEVKFSSRLQAYQLLAQHKGLLVNRIELDLGSALKRLAGMTDALLLQQLEQVRTQLLGDAAERARLRLPARVLDQEMGE